MSVTVRYFASARAASGVDEESLDGVTLDQIVAVMTQKHGAGLAKVLTACSYLIDGVAARDGNAAVADGATVDVLPPFAGG